MLGRDPSSFPTKQSPKNLCLQDGFKKELLKLLGFGLRATAEEYASNKSVTANRKKDFSTNRLPTNEGI
jgi:hypothetical protein